MDEREPALAFEGRLDFEFQVIMAVAPQVRSYVEQPETFRWREGPKLFRYTPDGLARTVHGPLYCEVKPQRILERSPDLDGRLQRIREECANRGGSFHIFTEKDVHNGELYRNSLAVWSAAQNIQPEEIGRSCNILRTLDFPATMREITQALGSRGWTLARALIGRRYLAFDLTQLLDWWTIISRGGRDW